MRFKLDSMLYDWISAWHLIGGHISGKFAAPSKLLKILFIRLETLDCLYGLIDAAAFVMEPRRLISRDSQDECEHPADNPAAPDNKEELCES
jgi:hypothetical protein